MRKEAAEGGFERRLRKDEGFEGLEVWKLEEGRFVIRPYTHMCLRKLRHGGGYTYIYMHT